VAARADEALFREAESDFARELAAAGALAKLLAEMPESPLVDQAIYERAWIAYKKHAWDDARVHLAALRALSPTPLAEQGRYLECRIAVETQQPDATACLERFRVIYPQSAHDLEVMGLLVELRAAAGGCAAARGMIDELVLRHEGSAPARAWAQRCPGPH
jgi:outer membrane protein assembly factor BamD (BamD/ComL family)